MNIFIIYKVKDTMIQIVGSFSSFNPMAHLKGYKIIWIINKGIYRELQWIPYICYYEIWRYITKKFDLGY